MVFKFLIIIFSIFMFIGGVIWLSVAGYHSYDGDEVKPTTFIASSLLTAIGLFVFIFLPWNIHQVNTGEVAVVRHMGTVQGYREQGVYWDSWLTNSYEKYDTKVQQINIQTPTYSKDSQTIDLELTIQYQIVPGDVTDIASKYGDLGKLESRIEAVALDKIKSIFSGYSADEVIAKRPEISTEITKKVEDATKDGYYVTMNNIVLTNINFTDDFELAIAQKVSAQQDALRAENEKQKAITEAEAKLETTKKDADAQLYKATKEAEALLVKAQAEADALELQKKAISEAIQVYIDTLGLTPSEAVKLYEYLSWVETWDGKTLHHVLIHEHLSDDVRLFIIGDVTRILAYGF